MNEDNGLKELSILLDESPASIALALEGLDAIDPVVRSSLIRALAPEASGACWTELLRLLAHAPDALTQEVSLESLARLDQGLPEVIDAWLSLAVEHPSAAIRSRALKALASGRPAEAPETFHRAPGIVSGWCTEVNHAGVGLVLVLAEHNGSQALVCWSCDVSSGIRLIAGTIDPAENELREYQGNLAASAGPLGVVEDAGLAVRLLAAGLAAARVPCALAARFWIERTLGRRFIPAPLAVIIADIDLAGVTHEELVVGSARVLEQLPGWLDRSELTFEIAREIALRSQGSEKAPDPTRDSGAYRYLFEHLLIHRVEIEVRKLLWMSLFWKARGCDELSRWSAILARRLSDPQHVVPSHPYLAELSTRSLAAAMRAPADA